jgi:amidohydrolase
MDALPLQEEVKISYASKVKNKMHACGHDAHTANLLGCALILNDMKNQFSGNIKLMFQPSEEVGEGGAKPMIDAGILKNPTVDAAIGLHVSGSTEIGNIELSRGKSSAAVDDFKITINAVGGHVSRPHNSANPCFIASQFVAGINSIIDKAVNPLKLPLVGICVIRGGEEGANNVIPTSTFIEGTTRSFDNSIRKDIPKIMEKYLQGLCLSAPTKATYKIDYLFLYPPLINDDKMVDLIYDVSTNLLGKNKFHYKPEGFGAEDFAYLTQNVPSVFYYVGVKDPKNKTQCCSVHSGTFSFDSKQFFTTAIPTMVISALEYLLK